jgi:hypothetical protein
LAKLLRFESDAEFLKQVLTSEDVWAGRASPIPYADVLKMMRLGYIRKVAAKDVWRTGLVFTVLEEKVDGERRRWIHWPKQWNTEVEDAGKEISFSLPALFEHLADGRLGPYQMIYDLTMGFNQFPLPEPAQHMHGFCVRNPSGKKEYFLSTVMVMGAKPSPLRLQKVFEEVVAEAVRRWRGTRPHSVTWKVHIDGVRFVGPLAELQQLQQHFVHLCADVGLTLKPEEVNTPHQVGEWMGVTHDLAKKSVALTGKTVAKLRAARAKVLGEESVTAETLISVFGLLGHYSGVLNAPLFAYWAAVKLVRRIAADIGAGRRKPDDIVTLWPSARADFERWFRFLDETPSAPMPNRGGRHTVVLFTDASKHGWGAVLIVNGSLLHIGGRWDPKTAELDINTLEALAVTNGVKHFAQYLAEEELLLVIDNTTAMHGLVRGSAQAGRLNAAVGTALVALGLAKPTSIQIVYIESARNPADGPSRNAGVSCTLHDLEATIAKLLATKRIASQTAKRAIRPPHNVHGGSTCAGVSGGCGTDLPQCKPVA